MKGNIAHMKGNMAHMKGNMALMKGNMALTKGTWRCATLDETLGHSEQVMTSGRSEQEVVMTVYDRWSL